MNRDDANRELNRLIAHYRALPFDELLALADQPAIETESSAPDGVVTYVVGFRQVSPDSVRVDVPAFGNNWFKLERLDESVVVPLDAGSEAQSIGGSLAAQHGFAAQALRAHLRLQCKRRWVSLARIRFNVFTFGNGGVGKTSRQPPRVFPLIEWTDISDRDSRLFSGTFTHEPPVSDALQHMLDSVRSRLAGAGHADSFDHLLLEVGLDTGRLTLAATNADAHSRGHADSCFVRLQSLQDIWYDAEDALATDDSFSSVITNHIRDVGTTFLELLPNSLPSLLNSSSPSGFTFRLFGGDPGVSIMDQHFPRFSGG